MNVTVNWQDIKDFVDERGVSLQFVEFDTRYTLVAFDGRYSLASQLFKTDPRNADQADFEDNYKATANIQISSRVSSLNSTSTPLGISGAFTGSFENVIGYANVALSVFSDQDSADGGLIIEYSSDGVNVDSSELYMLPANKGGQYSFGVLTKYLRVRYINGLIAQSEFRLQVIYHTNAPKPSSHRVEEVITGEHDAELSKAVITGRREDELFDNVGLSNSSSIKVAVTDRPSEVRGRTHVHINISRTNVLSGGSTVYTVTVGKTLYLHSVSLTIINTVNSIGEVRLRDGSTLKGTYLLGERAIGAPAPQTSPSPSLPEPMRFTTNVNFIQISGGVEVSGYLIGYEE